MVQHVEGLEARLQALGLTGDALLDAYPITGRMTDGPPLVLEEQRALLDLMQGMHRRFQLLQGSTKSRDAMTQSRHALNRTREAVWWRAKAILRSLADRRRADPPQPFVQIRDRKMYREFPVLARLVAGPALTDEERRNLRREMIETAVHLRAIAVTMSGSEMMAAAVVAEKTSFFWACAAHLGIPA